MDQCTNDLEEEARLKLPLRRSGPNVDPPRERALKRDLGEENVVVQ